jgi:hypothetical protein
MAKFKVGDEVKVIDGRNYYHSKRDSIGVITAIYKDTSYKVEFTHLTGAPHILPAEFSNIEEDTITKITKLHKALE